MASLKDIRRRIASVKNTQQITKAMKLVAASKLRRAQMAIAGARPFANKLEQLSSTILSDILSSSSISDPKKIEDFLKGLHPLLQTRAHGEDTFETHKKKLAFFVISSDRGLCGAYNSSVLKFAWKHYNEMLADPKLEVSLFFAGRRGADFFAKRGVRGGLFEDVWAGKFNSTKSDTIATVLTNKFLEGEFDAVEVVYTEFKSAMTQTVTLKQILPLSVKVSSIKEASPLPNAALPTQAAPYIYEPKRELLLSKLLPKQVQTQFYKVLADSLASELGARMTAMDNATRNAGDMISRLTLQANRVRQAAITTELMEIIGGAEALKG